MNQKLHTCLILALSFFTPLIAGASSGFIVSTPASTVHVGDTVLVRVDARIDGEAGINALGATLEVEGPAIIRAVQTGGSIFTLWPQLDASGGTTLGFVAGTPAGVSGTRLHVLTAALQATGAGPISFHVDHATAYAADGKGTALPLPSQSINLVGNASTTTSPDALAAARASDTTAPHPFDISLGRDSSVFGGAYFISFSTTDDGTGISKYEVIEGSNAPVVSDGTYVIHDQSLKKPITVIAYDGAGNTRTERLAAAGSDNTWQSALIAAIIIGMLIAISVLKKRRHDRRLHT